MSSNRQQLAALFVWRLTIGIVGGGSLPLIPAYAAQLGMQADLIGYYLAFGFSAIAVGTFVTGWLSDHFQRRKSFLIAASLVIVMATGLLGWVGHLGQLVLITAIWFFAGGIGFSIVAILTGLLAGEAERGRVFGALEVSGAVGSVIAGVLLGPIADQWGYRTMFTVLAVLACLLPLSGLVFKEEPTVPFTRAKPQTSSPAQGLKGIVVILLVSRVLAAVAGFVAQFGTPLTMNALGLSATAISLTGAVGGAVSLPLPLVTGWLSDRLGRKVLLIGMLFIGTLALVFLAGSVLEWHFWAVTSLAYIFQITGRGVGSAYMADMVAPESLGRGLSFYGGMEWIGGIIGYSATGYAIQNFGSSTTFFVGAALPLIAIGLLIPIRTTQVRTANAS